MTPKEIAYSLIVVLLILIFAGIAAEDAAMEMEYQASIDSVCEELLTC